LLKRLARVSNRFGGSSDREAEGNVGQSHFGISRSSAWLGSSCKIAAAKSPAAADI